MDLIIGTATAPFPADPDHVIGAWCAELRPEHGTPRRWRGVLPRTTPARLTAHAFIEGLRHLQTPTAVRAHAPSPPDVPTGGLGACLTAALAPHTLSTTDSGLNLDVYARQILRGTRKVKPSAAGGAYVPVQIPRLNLPTIITHDGRALHLRLDTDRTAPTLLSRTLSGPFLDDRFEFAPNGIHVPGPAVREVLW